MTDEERQKTKYHALVRTNPKGTTFVGRCILCGKEGLPAEAVQQLCLNPRGLSKEQVIIEVIDGDYD